MTDLFTTNFIAEIGVNHNGSYDMAMKLVEAAAKAGAKFAKFQIFDPKSLLSKETELVQYQKRSGEITTQNELLEGLSLTFSEFSRIHEACGDLNIEFLATPFDSNSLNFLVQNLGSSKIKIGSGDLTNLPLIWQAASSGLELILSTGMSNIQEVSHALAVISLAKKKAAETELSAELIVKESQNLDPQVYLESVTLLHCTSSYPAPNVDLNLKSIETLRREFRTRVGYSDHSLGSFATLAAVALGATLIEKHITLDKNLPGPDHSASAEPSEFSDLVSSVRLLEEAMGDGVKACTRSEAETERLARRGLYVEHAVDKGEKVKLSVLRPKSGLDPLFFWDYQNKPSSKRYSKGEIFYG